MEVVSFFFSSRRRHTRCSRDWSSDVCSSDLENRRNHLFKPLSWKVGHPTYAGIHWPVKNLFELKNAQRVLVEGNLFENNWLDAQNGFGILFTVRNQDGTAPWSVVQDVTFTNNIVRHSGSGVNILGYDNNHPSQQIQRILIRNNLFDDISGPAWGAPDGSSRCSTGRPTSASTTTRPSRAATSWAPSSSAVTARTRGSSSPTTSRRTINSVSTGKIPRAIPS